MTADPVFIVLHVPKCAGSTIERHLWRQLGPGAFWSPAKRSRHLPIELMGRKYDRRLPGPAAAIRAVSGHFVGRSVETVFAGRPIHRSVLLREPAALMLSWYNFRMGRYGRQGVRPYGFDLHLASLPPDPVAHFLLARWLEVPWWRLAVMSLGEKVARLDAMLSGFDRVADVAGCDSLIAEIAGPLRIPARAVPENTGADQAAAGNWTPLRLDGLDRDQRVSLDRRTGLDRYLWERWALKRPGAVPPATAPSFLGGEIGRAGADLGRRLARVGSG